VKKICSRCILDSDFPKITFDENNVCNYCHNFDKIDIKYALNKENTEKFLHLIKIIKDEGKSKEYDCILGVSGGRDSTYCLYLLKKWGLNPLAVHYDNNMDSKIAAENIKKGCNALDVDLHIFVVDWEEYKDLQRSFLKASVPSVDIPTDHAFISVLYAIAYEKKIRYIFNGSSFRTEGPIPPEWSLHNDASFILDIQKKFGTKILKNFSIRRLKDLILYRISGIMVVEPLKYVPYIHDDVEKIITGELGWQYYGGHHFESIFTRWAFAYLLPKKFGIDKRLTDYSTLVRSRQMTREEALRKMNEILYPSVQEKEDRRYIMNKLELTHEEMNDILTAPPHSNFDYRHYPLPIRFLYRLFRPVHF